MDRATDWIGQQVTGNPDWRMRPPPPTIGGVQMPSRLFPTSGDVRDVARATGIPVDQRAETPGGRIVQDAIEGGLSLPGNGTVVATHADRERLFKEAGRRIVELARRYYEQDDESVLPRSIASYRAFENAISLDVAMGGSTNTVLHLLAAAKEAGVDFTMQDIDRVSRQVPCLCKVAPAVADVHIEDVHRAGGIMAILGELNRAGLLHTDVPTVHSKTLGEALTVWDVMQAHDAGVFQFYKAAPGGVPTQVAFSQDRRWNELDMDRSRGVIRDKANAFSQDGGLAVLYGNVHEGVLLATVVMLHAFLPGVHWLRRERDRSLPETQETERFLLFTASRVLPSNWVWCISLVLFGLSIALLAVVGPRFDRSPNVLKPRKSEAASSRSARTARASCTAVSSGNDGGVHATTPSIAV